MTDAKQKCPPCNRIVVKANQTLSADPSNQNLLTIEKGDYVELYNIFVGKDRQKYSYEEHCNTKEEIFLEGNVVRKGERAVSTSLGIIPITSASTLYAAPYEVVRTDTGRQSTVLGDMRDGLKASGNALLKVTGGAVALGGKGIWKLGEVTIGATIGVGGEVIRFVTSHRQSTVYFFSS